MSARETLPVIRRSFRVLEAVATRGEGMTFREIRALFPEAPASTVSRMLKALLEEELLEKPRHLRPYRLGPAARRLGRTIRGRLDRAALLRPLVAELARNIGHSCAYFELRERAVTLVAKHEVPDAFHYMGEGESHVHFLRHSAGEMLLAHQPEAVRDALLTRFSDPERADRALLLRELEAVRAADVWCGRREDPAHIRRIVAPVFDGEAFAGALAATLPGATEADAMTRIAGHVRDAAARASRWLSDS